MVSRSHQSPSVVRRACVAYAAQSHQPVLGIVQQFCNEHAERNPLAFVYGYLGDHDLWAVRTEAEKYLVLATLNLVECIAFVGSAAAAK